MYSYNPGVFHDSDVCGKCTVFAALEARLSELEASLANGRLAPPPVAGGANPNHTRTQNGWVTVSGQMCKTRKLGCSMHGVKPK